MRVTANWIDLGVGIACQWKPGILIKGVSQVKSFEKKNELKPAQALVDAGDRIIAIKRGCWVIDFPGKKRTTASPKDFTKYFTVV